MKIFYCLFFILFVVSCSSEAVEDVDFSKYFNGVNGTAVFYNPKTQKYKIHNPSLSLQRNSPCSTFKIISSYIALSENTVSLQNSQRKWNKILYWHHLWNKDMTLPEAFKVSCIWYYRRLIDEVGQAKVKSYLAKLNYGNQNIADWEGKLNTNSNNRDLMGFWVESSLRISPKEQTQVLAKIFEENNQVAIDLEDIMQVTEHPVKVYGKTGMGVKDDKIADAWFVGFYEQNKQKIFFAIRLDDATNDNVEDYRHQASLYAKQIALDIINNEKLF